jgi:hypothetical protein
VYIIRQKKNQYEDTMLAARSAVKPVKYSLSGKDYGVLAVEVN